MLTKDIEQLCVAFVVGNRGSRTQTLPVEYELRRKTDVINKEIEKRSSFIEQWSNAFGNTELARNQNQRMFETWNHSKKVVWYFIVSKLLWSQI